MFNKTKIFTVLMCVAVATMSGVARAATSDGCDKETNDRITSELALCTTHAYNIGLTTNPESDADRQLMRDVVALKTTVMTQQMYKQYEYLDATIRRMKTQLEKAILTTKLQAAGASSTDGSSGSATNNRNQVLNGAYDCIAETSKTAAFQCLTRNISLIRSAISSGNIGEAKRQLEKDVDAYTMWNGTSAGNAAAPSGCGKNELSANRTSTEKCVNSLTIAISNAIDDYNPQNKTTTPTK